MKKIVVALLLLAMPFTACACSKADEADDTYNDGKDYEDVEEDVYEDEMGDPDLEVEEAFPMVETDTYAAYLPIAL